MQEAQAHTWGRSRGGRRAGGPDHEEVGQDAVLESNIGDGVNRGHCAGGHAVSGQETISSFTSFSLLKNESLGLLTDRRAPGP